MPNNPYADAKSFLSTNPRRTIQLLAESNFSSDPEALFLRGVAFFRLREFPSAENSFRGAIALDATRSDAFYYLGLALERRGVNADAVKAYRAALSLDPSLTKAREKLTLLGALVEPAPTAPRPKERRPIETELTLPDEEEQFADYERRKRKKAIIDTRAEYEGQLKGMPAWAKGLTAVFFVFLFAFMGFVFINLFATHDSEQRRDIEKRTRELQQQGEEIRRQNTIPPLTESPATDNTRADARPDGAGPPNAVEPLPDPSKPLPPSPAGGVPSQPEPVPSPSPRLGDRGQRPVDVPAGAVRWSVEATTSNFPAAGDMVSRLASMGYAARVVAAKKYDKLALYVVRIGSYETKSEADSIAARLSKDGLRTRVVLAHEPP